MTDDVAIVVTEGEVGGKEKNTNLPVRVSREGGLAEPRFDLHASFTTHMTDQVLQKRKKTAMVVLLVMKVIIRWMSMVLG